MKLKFRKEDLFWVFLYLNVFCKGIGLGNNSSIYFILIIFGTLSLALKIISSKYTKKEFLFVVICGLIGLVSFIITRKPTLMLTCLCLMGMKNIDLDKAFKSMYKIRLVTFIGIITLALTGIIENSSIQMWRSGHLDLRYSLGFGHPNTLHLSLFILIALYLYTHYDKLKLKDLIFLMLANLIIYHYSVSRTGVIVTFILIILTFISLKFKKFDNVIIKTPKYLYITLFAFSFLTGILYGKVPIINNLDNIFNGRIEYTHYYLTSYNLSLFGHDIANDTNAFFDNGYTFLYVQYGLIGLIFISYLIFNICKNAEKEKNIKKSTLLICFMIYIFTESFSPNIFMNIILFFIADYIFLKKESKENERTLPCITDAS